MEVWKAGLWGIGGLFRVTALMGQVSAGSGILPF
jgi:hypothetical protein